MTLAEFNRKKDYWHKEVSYYSWALAQSSSDKLHKHNLEKYEEAMEKYERLKRIEKNILTEGLKNVII